MTDDYNEGDNRFTGKIRKVTIQLGESNLSDEGKRAIGEMFWIKALEE